MADDALLFVAQKAFIQNPKGEVLVLNDPIMGFDLPGGKVQQGETDFEGALQREVQEETGLDITVGRPFTTWYYEFAKGTKHRHAGKILYVVAFSCHTQSDMVRLSDEHDTYTWVKKEDLLKLEETKDYRAVIEKYLQLKDD